LIATLGREVAIKVIRKDVFENEQELVRYLREARIIAALNHPNIVTLFDVGRLPDARPYMVMEYVSGQSLNRILQSGVALPLDMALHIFEQVARALGHAHRHGVIHRDIKPGNILVRDESTGYPRVKVADFGVASMPSAHVTHDGAFIGTPMYMSPEQAQGRPVVAASDLYSLGILMYRALTGVRPFDADSPVALAMCHVNDRVPPMREAAPDAGVPAELEAIVMKCLEKDPARRYQSADQLLAALDGVTARYAPYLHGHSQDSLDVTPVPGRAPRLAVIAGLLLLLAFLGGLRAGVSYRGHDAREPPAQGQGGLAAPGVPRSPSP
jgi:eukaryotic-like serine/threonine-protein kinase